MDSLILWMNRRKGITLFASAVYFASVVLLHEEVSKISVWLQKSLTLHLYNTVITVFSISIVVFLSLYALLKLGQAKRRVSRVAYLFFTFFCAAASYNTLIVSNVEAIHFPQYAFLVLPVFALTRSYSETLLSVSLLGAFDEAYQYFIFKNWTYFDFNDILLNVIGGCIGVAFIFAVLGERSLSSEKPRSLVKSPAFVVTAGLLIAALIMNAVGLLQLYPPHNGTHALILLSKKPPAESFWVTFKWGKRYHVLSAMEGILLCGGLIGFYTFMDRNGGS
jgi:hypothetical protein